MRSIDNAFNRFDCKKNDRDESWMERWIEGVLFLFFKLVRLEQDQLLLGWKQ